MEAKLHKAINKLDLSFINYSLSLRENYTKYTLYIYKYTFKDYIYDLCI